MKKLILSLCNKTVLTENNDPNRENSMLTKLRVWRAALLVIGGLTLAGCGGSGVESGTNDLLTCSVPNVPNEAGTEDWLCTW